MIGTADCKVERQGGFAHTWQAVNHQLAAGRAQNFQQLIQLLVASDESIDGGGQVMESPAPLELWVWLGRWWRKVDLNIAARLVGVALVVLLAASCWPRGDWAPSATFSGEAASLGGGGQPNQRNTFSSLSAWVITAQINPAMKPTPAGNPS